MCVRLFPAAADCDTFDFIGTSVKEIDPAHSQQGSRGVPGLDEKEADRLGGQERS